MRRCPLCKGAGDPDCPACFETGESVGRETSRLITDLLDEVRLLIEERDRALAKLDEVATLQAEKIISGLRDR